MAQLPVHEREGLVDGEGRMQVEVARHIEEHAAEELQKALNGDVETRTQRLVAAWQALQRNGLAAGGRGAKVRVPRGLGEAQRIGRARPAEETAKKLLTTLARQVEAGDVAAAGETVGERRQAMADLMGAVEQATPAQRTEIYKAAKRAKGEARMREGFPAEIEVDGSPAKPARDGVAATSRVRGTITGSHKRIAEWIRVCREGRLGRFANAARRAKATAQAVAARRAGTHTAETWPTYEEKAQKVRRWQAERAARAEAGRRSALGAGVLQEEVTFAAAAMKSGKAAGRDGNLPEVLRAVVAAGGKGFAVIWLGVAAMWMAGALPEELQWVMEKPLYKGKGKPRELYSSYRPVMLHDALAHLYHKVVMNKTKHWLRQTPARMRELARLLGEPESDVRAAVNASQCGFAPDMRGTFEPLVVARMRRDEGIRASGADKGYIFELYADVADAFPSLDHVIILYVLRTRFGVKGRLWDAHAALIDGVQTSVQIGEFFTACQEILVGVSQGSGHSPMHWSLVFNEVAEWVRVAHATDRGDGHEPARGVHDRRAAGRNATVRG